MLEASTSECVPLGLHARPEDKGGEAMESFLSEAAQDEARLARIFAHCDADGDGVLSRAE